MELDHFCRKNEVLTQRPKICRCDKGEDYTT